MRKILTIALLSKMILWITAVPAQPDPGLYSNTRWGKLIIEGEIAKSKQEDEIPPDVINIQSNGATFAPVIEVTGDPLVEWIFDDLTTSSSLTPVKDYGSRESRRNFLRVTPWSALVGINVGYDAADGGYGNFAMIPHQNVLKLNNLQLAENLEYLCANYSLLTELDLRGLDALRFVELFRARSLSRIHLDNHPVLERLCVEDCDLDSLDLSGCPGLKDLRAAMNEYKFINWGSIGQLLWHICIRDNPQMEVNLPDLTQFPVLWELLIWNTNQKGAFVCSNPRVREITAYANHYTSADLTGCTNLKTLDLSENPLNLLNLGSAAQLANIKLRNCGLSPDQVDNVLKTLDEAGRLNGYLDLSGNASASFPARTHYFNLKNKGWTIVEITTDINFVPGNTDNVKMSITGHEIRLDFLNDFSGWNATLYDLNGRFILARPVNENIFTLDITLLAPGLYFIALSNGADKHIFKFIKP